MDDMALKIFQAVLCPTQLFEWKLICTFNYCISGIFRVGKFWRKRRLEGVLNFHWVLFSLFQGLPMKTYSRVYFSLCLFLAISGRSRTYRKLNPHEKFPIYGSTVLATKFPTDLNSTLFCFSKKYWKLLHWHNSFQDVMHVQKTFNCI